MKVVSLVFLLQSVLYFVENASSYDWSVTSQWSSYETSAIQIFHLSNSTSRYWIEGLSIITFICDVYNLLAIYFFELFFILTTFFFRQLVKESISEINNLFYNTKSSSFTYYKKVCLYRLVQN